MNKTRQIYFFRYNRDWRQYEIRKLQSLLSRFHKLNKMMSTERIVFSALTSPAQFWSLCCRWHFQDHYTINTSLCVYYSCKGILVHFLCIFVTVTVEPCHYILPIFYLIVFPKFVIIINTISIAKSYIIKFNESILLYSFLIPLFP